MRLPVPLLGVLLFAPLLAAVDPKPGSAKPAPVAEKIPVCVEVPNAGFEQGAQGWTAQVSEGVRVEPSTGVKGQGGKSLGISHPAAGAESAVLGPVLKLQTGKLYRLSAWVRTQGVGVDPVKRYPTALGACLSMASFPFTNSSPTMAGDAEGRLSVTFFALTAEDRVQLHLGRNGKATGSAWFDDVRLEEVPITEHIPMEKVRWAGKGFRYEEGGWSFVHIEGAPYERGHQYGRLVAQDLATFLEKLAIQQDKTNPEKGWAHLRQLTNALMFRKFDPEYLEEMKGIADGAAKAGAAFKGRAIDVLDVATLNSSVDFGALEEGLRTAPSHLSGRVFLKAEDEAECAGQGDHCSAFVATKSATKNGRFVTGQMFMWSGYTGVHWDVILDVVPTKGQRFVMQTFPGGIHSGADWYINASGLVIGETTVGQTPFDPEGTPQSNRIRKAAQYATSIDEVAKILYEKNNGLYTNDWVIADAKTGEGAIFLLGTRKTRLWRTGTAGKNGKSADTPGNLQDYVWANNNNRDLEVRKEYAVNPESHPVDLAFNTWNRDIALYQWYQQKGKGQIDLQEAVRFWATSPVQRPHACDGKLTTAEMAEKLMFIAHQGKTTHREKWVGSPRHPDLPGTFPHLTYAYTTFSPVYAVEALKEARKSWTPAPEAAQPRPDFSKVKELAAFDAKRLWHHTVYPASEAANWFSSGSAAYHALLRRLPADPAKAFRLQRDELAGLNARYGFFAQREGEQPLLQTRTAYDRYSAYQHPRIKGTFLLHQLRLRLGNETFAKVMGKVHETFAYKSMDTEAFLKTASEAAGRDLRPWVMPWLERTGLPDVELEAKSSPVEGGWEIALTLKPKGAAWPFMTSVGIETAKGLSLELVEAGEGTTTRTFRVTERPSRLIFNAGNDLPLAGAPPAALPNLLDEWERLLFVRGTSRFVEANRSLTTNFRDHIADIFTEVLLEVRPDAEVSESDLKERDLLLLGMPQDNSVVARLAATGALPVTFGQDFFRLNGRTFGRADEGLALALPSPWNPRRMVYLYAGNGPLQLWRQTRALQRGLPGYAIWRGDELLESGFLPAAGTVLKLD